MIEQAFAKLKAAYRIGDEGGQVVGGRGCIVANGAAAWRDHTRRSARPVQTGRPWMDASTVPAGDKGGLTNHAAGAGPARSTGRTTTADTARPATLSPSEAGLP